MAKSSTTKLISNVLRRSKAMLAQFLDGDVAQLKRALIQGIGMPGARKCDQGDRKGENFPAADQGPRAHSVRREDKAAIPIFRMEKERFCCLFADLKAKYSN